jgi:hypothetical protein
MERTVNGRDVKGGFDDGAARPGAREFTSSHPGSLKPWTAEVGLRKRLPARVDVGDLPA